MGPFAGLLGMVVRYLCLLVTSPISGMQGGRVLKALALATGLLSAVLGVQFLRTDEKGEAA